MPANSGLYAVLIEDPVHHVAQADVVVGDVVDQAPAALVGLDPDAVEVRRVRLVADRARVGVDRQVPDVDLLNTPVQDAVGRLALP